MYRIKFSMPVNLTDSGGRVVCTLDLMANTECEAVAAGIVAVVREFGDRDIEFWGVELLADVKDGELVAVTRGQFNA